MTSQQNEMFEKLPTLIKQITSVLDKTNVGYSYAHKYFYSILVPKYLENGKQKEFIEKTSLNHSVFQELNGNTKKKKTKTEKTLLKVVFGFGTTYEEALLFFYFNGKNLLTDDPYMGTINEILLELDKLPRDIGGIRRVDIMYSLAEEKGIKFS